MQMLGLVWGIVAALGMGVAFLPCLGSLQLAQHSFLVGRPHHQRHRHFAGRHRTRRTWRSAESSCAPLRPCSA